MRGADSPRPRPSAINPRPSHDTPMRLGIPIFAVGEVGGWISISPKRVRVFIALLLSSFIFLSDRPFRLADLYLGFEEFEGGEDDPRAEFPCPFCSEDFDIVGLCCHIDDEHPVEAKNGVLLHFPI